MKIRIPSKTFLWGEYSALIGGSAGVLTTLPYFEFNFEFSEIMKSDSLQNNITTLFHPESPAGLSLKDLNFNELEKTKPTFNEKILFNEFSFFDPHDLKGGFGRSTAEYIVTSMLISNNLKSYSAMVDSKNIQTFFDFSKKLWTNYKSLFKPSQNKPSGYDLLAQAMNIDFVDSPIQVLNMSSSTSNPSENSNSRLTLIEIKNEELEILNSPMYIDLNVLIFKTNTKIKTHEHLESLSLSNLQDLKSLSEKVTTSYLKKVRSDFIKDLKFFDCALKDLNYQHIESVATCQKISSLEGVLHARGCGALGADVIAVFYQAQPAEKLISRILKTSNLIFIADVMGID